MKAVVTALALLGFVAASTVPVVAHAQTKSEQTMTKKHKKAKKHVKKVSKKTSKKRAAKPATA